MQYKKKMMSKSELIADGWGERELEAIYRARGQTVAHRSGNARNSKIMFDTEELEKYRLSRCKANR
ncbi:MAG: hypothetical protein IJV29_06235 [Butyrivibrio sp.]|nr:hypothetical protein [Butyrivibrio sp.]